jgi:hypothetical protein
MLKAIEPVGDAQTRSVDTVQHVNACHFRGITCTDMDGTHCFRYVWLAICSVMTKTLSPLMHRGQ